MRENLGNDIRYYHPSETHHHWVKMSFVKVINHWSPHVFPQYNIKGKTHLFEQHQRQVLCNTNSHSLLQGRWKRYLFTQDTLALHFTTPSASNDLLDNLQAGQTRTLCCKVASSYRSSAHWVRSQINYNTQHHSSKNDKNKYHSITGSSFLHCCL